MSIILFSSISHGVLRTSLSKQSYRSRAIYMSIDGKPPRFVINHNVSLDNGRVIPIDNLEAVKRMTQQLVETQGRFFATHGQFDDPFALLAYMDKYQLSFSEDSRHLKVSVSSEGFTDIRGNLEQQSCAFSFRFYCDDALGEWLDAALCVDPNTMKYWERTA